MTHSALHCSDYENAQTPEGAAIGPDDYVMRTSTVGQADWCPGRLAVEAPANEAMLFGTLVHSLVEEQINEPDLMPGDHMAFSLADQLMLDEGVLIPALLGGEGRYNDWVYEALHLSIGWRTWARTLLDWPLQGAITERRLAAPVGTNRGGHRVWLGGTPDCILTRLLPTMMMDVKTTSGKGWYQGRADSQNQTQAYPWLARQVLGLGVERFVYVVGNRTTGLWQHYEAKIDGNTTAGFLARALATANMLEAEAYTYHPRGADGRRNWFCNPKWCSAWDQCPARFLGDTTDSLTTVENGG